MTYNTGIRPAVLTADKSSSKESPQKIKDPFKLVLEVIYFVWIFIPLTIWAMLSTCLRRKKNVEGQVVLVTGAGNGLGRSLCMKFAKLGCKIACVDLNDIDNSETVKLIKQKYPGAVASSFHCNVASVEDIKALSKNVVRELGEVDILVNNAGLVSGSNATDFDNDYLGVMLDVNLKSHFLMNREFLPSMMKRNSGHIVAVASLAGLFGVANSGMYSATKHGLIGLMETLYDELRAIPNNKVQTTCLCPYFIVTNQIYVHHWNLRMPAMKVEDAVDASIDAILKNRRLVSVPSSFFYLSLFIRLIPDNLRNIFRSIFYTECLLPSDENRLLHVSVEQLKGSNETQTS